MVIGVTHRLIAIDIESTFACRQQRKLDIFLDVRRTAMFYRQ